MMTPASEAELAALVADHHGRAAPLWLAGGGTRLRLPQAATLSTRALSGVVTYEPGELTLIARAGTPLAEIEALLADQGQALAFEPMDHRAILGTTGEPTIGGVVAANVSGPRRVLAGACRDHLLGVRFVDGRGRVIRNGGRVMKNVTGMDLGRLVAGSFGTLAVLTEVALKTLPLPEAQETLAFPGLDAAQAVALFSAALATPFEVSGAAFHAGTAWLRIEGLAAQVAYRRARLTALLRDHTPEVLDADASRALWQGLRDVAHFAGEGALWRILVKPTDAPATVAALARLGGDSSLDWGGGLIWYRGPGEPAQLRQAAGTGLAMLLRPSGDTPPLFPAEPPGVAAISAALRRTFDPAGILNPGLMEG